MKAILVVFSVSFALALFACAPGASAPEKHMRATARNYVDAMIAHDTQRMAAMGTVAEPTRTGAVEALNNVVNDHVPSGIFAEAPSADLPGIVVPVVVELAGESAIVYVEFERGGTVVDVSVAEGP